MRIISPLKCRNWSFAQEGQLKILLSKAPVIRGLSGHFPHAQLPGPSHTSEVSSKALDIVMSDPHLSLTGRKDTSFLYSCRWENRGRSLAQGRCTPHQVSSSMSLTAGQENLSRPSQVPSMSSLSLLPEPHDEPPNLLSNPGWD